MDTQLNSLISITNDIYNSLGPGYNEVIYHRAFEVALRLNGINYESEVVCPINYKGHCVGHGKIDLIINKSLIIELKAITNLNNNEVFIQIKNYMKQYNINEGLIINFGQVNKSNYGETSIKYIVLNDQSTRVFNFVNNTFVELVQKPPLNEMNL